MKRPIAFHFVAVWCCLAVFAQASQLMPERPANPSPEDEANIFRNLLLLIPLALLIWQAVGLWRLRRINRWFAIFICACWAGELVFNFAFRLFHQATIPGRVFVFVPLLTALNILSAWYLARRSFRVFADQFEAEHQKERHSRSMQKVSQQKIRDETRNR